MEPYLKDDSFQVMLERFEKSNCMLATCNGLSQSRLAAATKELSQVSA